MTVAGRGISWKYHLFGLLWNSTPPINNKTFPLLTANTSQKTLKQNGNKKNYTGDLNVICHNRCFISVIY